MRGWPLAVFALLLAGCSTAPARPPVGNPARVWQTREAELSLLNAWDISGRLALRTAHEGGQAALRWVWHDDEYTIDLSGPLGRGLVRLRQDRSGASLEDADRHVYHAKNAERLLLERTGLRIPLNGLSYWIRGLPVPGVPDELELDSAGRLHSLHQLGWEIDFLAYRQYDRYDLPSHINLTLAGPPPGTARDLGTPPSGESEYPVVARLVIQRWVLPK